MRNLFVLFDVAMEIARKQFHSSKKDAEKNILLREQKPFRQRKNDKCDGSYCHNAIPAVYDYNASPVSLVFEKTILKVIIATMLSK